MLLVSGCSYLHNKYFQNIFCHNKGPDRVKFLPRGGAGNQYIADSIVNNLSAEVTEVFVLWTGFNRIDVPFSWQEPFAKVKPWHQTTVKCTTWLHSGGVQGGLMRDEIPAWLNAWIKHQYLTFDWDYLIDQNMRHVVGCLSTLEALGINYAFGFIYDIYHDYSDRFFLGGAVPRDHHLLPAINWKKCLSVTPYEYCRDQNLLAEDGIHPNDQGYQSWWNTVQPELPFSLT